MSESIVLIEQQVFIIDLSSRLQNLSESFGMYLLISVVVVKLTFIMLY